MIKPSEANKMRKRKKKEKRVNHQIEDHYIDLLRYRKNERK